MCDTAMPSRGWKHRRRRQRRGVSSCSRRTRIRTTRGRTITPAPCSAPVLPRGRVVARLGARPLSRSPSSLASSLSASPATPPPRPGAASRSLPNTVAARTTTSVPVPPVGRCRTPGCTSCCRGTGRPPGTKSQSHRPALTSRYRSQPAESAGAGLPSRGTHRTDTLRLTAGKSNGKVSMLNRRVESGSRCRRLTLAPLAAYPQRCVDRTGQSIPRNPLPAIAAVEI